MSAVRRVVVTSIAVAIVATPGVAALGLAPSARTVDSVVIAGGPGCCK